MKKILFLFLLITLVYNFLDEEYVELPKYGSITVKRGYISLDIDGFKKGDKISIEIMLDSSRLPNEALSDTFTLEYLQENSKSSYIFTKLFNTTTSPEDKKSSSIHHYFAFTINLEKKTKYLLFKDVYYYEAPITVKHLHKKNSSVGTEEIVFIIIFVCIVALFFIAVYCIIKWFEKNSKPRPQIPDTPIIPSDNNQNYELPYYEK